MLTLVILILSVTFGTFLLSLIVNSLWWLPGYISRNWHEIPGTNLLEHQELGEFLVMCAHWLLPFPRHVLSLSLFHFFSPYFPSLENVLKSPPHPNTAAGCWATLHTACLSRVQGSEPGPVLCNPDTGLFSALPLGSNEDPPVKLFFFHDVIQFGQSSVSCHWHLRACVLW